MLEAKMKNSRVIIVKRPILFVQIGNSDKSPLCNHSVHLLRELLLIGDVVNGHGGDNTIIDMGQGITIEVVVEQLDFALKLIAFELKHLQHRGGVINRHNDIDVGGYKIA